mmetsp:Transcript_23379/g.46703  ORF Transcript_23379/g.46703 Transcript_23379/m.46703 type:complete len:90 (+) Transcript_23379:459-728(+)
MAGEASRAASSLASTSAHQPPPQSDEAWVVHGGDAKHCEQSSELEWEAHRRKLLVHRESLGPQWNERLWGGGGWLLKLCSCGRKPRFGS